MLSEIAPHLLFSRPSGRRSPSPDKNRRPDHKSLQAEATTCRTSVASTASGFFFVAVNMLFSSDAEFAGVCVTTATPLDIRIVAPNNWN
jgi:hypothetical protein